MSRKPYACYVCERNGFPNTMVYLAGKDANNKTIYLEEDGSPHIHKQQQQQQQLQQQQQQVQQGQGQGSTTVVTEPTSLKIINAKLDKIIALLTESESQQR